MANTPRKNETDPEKKRKAQIDLVIERADSFINLCEMKFSIGPYVIRPSYAEDVRRRIRRFAEEEKTSYKTINTFVTTFGVASGASNEIVESELTAEDLFK